MDGQGWQRYLADYHGANAGITEAALEHARHDRHGTAYDWLAAAVPRPAGDVVDLACGSCPTQPRLDYRSYLGIDSSPAEVAAAGAAGRGPVRVGDVTDLQLPDATADTVIISMALMLLPLQETLAEVARVLRPGGTLAAIVPATWPLRPPDLVPLGVLVVCLGGPGSMPHQLGSRRLGRATAAAGLSVRSLARERFPFPLATPADADLAVRALYTPGRSDRQRRRAAAALVRLPSSMQLPVPLLRLVAVRPVG